MKNEREKESEDKGEKPDYMSGAEHLVSRLGLRLGLKPQQKPFLRQHHSRSMNIADTTMRREGQVIVSHYEVSGSGYLCADSLRLHIEPDSMHDLNVSRASN